MVPRSAAVNRGTSRAAPSRNLRLASRSSSRPPAPGRTQATPPLRVRPGASQHCFRQDPRTPHAAGINPRPVSQPHLDGSSIMSLPTSRDVTLTPASKLPSSVINKLQDCVIGRKRPPWTRRFYPRAISVSPANWTPIANPSGAGRAPTAQLTDEATTIFEIPFEDGDRIIGIDYDAYGLSSCTGIVKYASTMGAAPATLGSWSDPDRVDGWGTVTVPGFVPQLCAATSVLWMEITTAVGSPRYTMGLISATFDRL